MIYLLLLKNELYLNLFLCWKCLYFRCSSLYWTSCFHICDKEWRNSLEVYGRWRPISTDYLVTRWCYSSSWYNFDFKVGDEYFNWFCRTKKTDWNSYFNASLCNKFVTLSLIGWCNIEFDWMMLNFSWLQILFDDVRETLQGQTLITYSKMFWLVIILFICIIMEL